MDDKRAIITAMVVDKMVAFGIIPYASPQAHMLEYINSLPKDEARKLKRKFRKLHRKLCPELDIFVDFSFWQPDSTYSPLCSAKNPKPDKKQKMRRRQSVFNILYRQALAEYNRSRSKNYERW